MIRYVKMQRSDEVADVADFEKDVWQAAGFEVCNADVVSKTEEQAETQAEAPVKRRGRPRKAD